MATFYSEKLKGVYNIRALKKVIKEKGNDEFLKMEEKDIILTRPDDEMLSTFPGHTIIDGIKFRYSYKFAPGSDEDGVTVSIPSSMVSRFPPEHLEWVVPGLYKEKVTALLKGLPKRYRKKIVPIPEKVDVIIKELERSNQPLITALADFIYKRFGVDIPTSEWPVEDIPEHLKMRVSIVDHKGHEIESGRGIEPLIKERMARSKSKDYPGIWKKAKEKWERSDVIGWDFDDLPTHISINEQMTAYPGLESVDGTVNVRLFENLEDALKNHKQGVRDLFQIALKKDIRFVKRVTKLPNDVVSNNMYFGDLRKYEKEILSSFFENLFNLDIRTRVDFSDHVERIKSNINTEAEYFMRLAGKILHKYHLVRTKLHDLETSNKRNSAILGFVAGIRKDLDILVPRNFHQIYKDERLAHIPRYLKAMAIRAERGVNDLEKDHRKAEQLEVFIESLVKIKEGLSNYVTKEKMSAINEFQWAIEEYRVSLFAPELKTAIPVSQKRLNKRIKEINRMI
jgi:ATP-dependent helicase HrpA